MELEALRTDLLAVINHYGKTIPVGPLFYVVKDVAREVGDAYENWLTAKNAEKPAPAEEPEPAEKVEGAVEE